MASVYQNVIRSFPKGYSLAFAYGSGVMCQLGNSTMVRSSGLFIKTKKHECFGLYVHL